MSKIDSQTFCDSEVICHLTQESTSSRDLTQAIFQPSAGSTMLFAAEQALCPLHASRTSRAHLPRAPPCHKQLKLPQRERMPSETAPPLSPAIQAALPRRPLPGEASGEALGEPLTPAGAPSHGAARRPSRARPAACLTFSPVAPLRHLPGRLDPALGPHPRPSQTAPQPRTQLARSTAHYPPARLAAPGLAGVRPARSPQGPDNRCHRRLCLSPTAHNASRPPSPRGNARPPGIPSSFRAPQLGPGEETMALSEEDSAFPARRAPV